MNILIHIDIFLKFTPLYKHCSIVFLSITSILILYILRFGNHCFVTVANIFALMPCPTQKDMLTEYMFFG